MKDPNTKKLKWQLPFLVLLVLGTIYAIKNNPTAPYQKDEGKIFGTFYHATYQYKENIQQEIIEELRKVDASLSMFNKKSIISQINRNEGVKPDTFFLEVYNLSKAVSEQTSGAFDITVAPLVNVWGFGFKNEAMPDSATIDSLCQFVGFKKITLVNDSIQKQDERTILDCSAVAKGFGNDVVARLFKRKGIKNYMIEIGGEVVVKGVNPSGKPWKVGINTPQDDPTQSNKNLQAILNLSEPIAMATSGNYRNFYYKDGKKLAHTIDPRSGYPVQHSILSSTVLAQSCATADAYATAFMVLGLEKAQEVLNQHPELQVYFIYADEEGNLQTYITPSLEKLIQK